MSSLQEIKALVDQIPVSVASEGDKDNLAMSKLGQLFTANWRERLLLAGVTYTTHLGTLTDGNDMTMIVAGGNGTIPDLDQPEVVIAVDSGYYLIPIEAEFIVTSDNDAPDDYETIIMFADRTQATAAGATGTVNTPLNKLDGAGAFPGRAFTAITSDITDPVVSELLAVARTKGVAVVMQGSAANEDDVFESVLRLEYKPSVPSILAGPCQLVVIGGGTVATSIAGYVTYACVPSSWFPVS